jgi:hypothetical protein
MPCKVLANMAKEASILLTTNTARTVRTNGAPKMKPISKKKKKVTKFHKR